jgi:hypothetical protein
MLNALRSFERHHEARPATSGIKLVQTAEEWNTGNNINIDPVIFEVVIFMCEGAFCPAVLSHFIFNWAELLA